MNKNEICALLVEAERELDSTSENNKFSDLPVLRSVVVKLDRAADQARGILQEVLEDYAIKR